MFHCHTIRISMKNLERPLNVTDNFDFMWYFYMQFSLKQSFRLKDSSSCKFRVIIWHGVAVLPLPRDLLHSNATHPTNQPNEWMWNIETASDETVANGMKYCNFILLITIWNLASLLMSMPLCSTGDWNRSKMHSKWICVLWERIQAEPKTSLFLWSGCVFCHLMLEPFSSQSASDYKVFCRILRLIFLIATSKTPSTTVWFIASAAIKP